MTKISFFGVALAVLLVSASAYKYTPCGGRCGGYLPKCEKGTRCYYGVCKAKNLGLGSKCSKCKECRSPYICKDGVCSEKPKPPSACGGPCNSGGFPNKCSDGSVCNGKECVKPAQAIGQSCAKDCESCKAPLICKDGKCAIKLEPPQPCGGKCNVVPFPTTCSDGSVCKGTKCVKPAQDVGQSCAKDCESCKAPLICKDGKCAVKMELPQPCGGKCNTGAFPNKCSDGSVCKGTTCVKPSQGLGKSCAKPCETCKSPLICSKGKCAFKLVGCGGSCGRGLKCERGLRCRGGTCKKTNVRAGGACSSCKICRYGYKCLNGKCSRPLSPCGGSCGGFFGRKCASGLVCLHRRCAKLVGGGHKCGGCVKCKKGYRCNSYSKKCTRSY